jgi:hypothetical protein
LSIEAAREIISKLDLQMGNRPLGNPYVNDPFVKTFPFSKDRFRKITATHSERKLAFVDGGNLELLGAPNFSVQLNRIHASVWKNNKRYTELKLPELEFFSAIFSTIRDDGKMVYETLIVPCNPVHKSLLPESSDLSFSPFEDSVRMGTQMAGVSSIGSIARNFAEWKFAAHVTGFLDRNDVLVMDGSLQTNFKNEQEYFRTLEETTQNHDVILSSISKTSSLFTDSGLSLLGAISQFAKNAKVEGEWCHPVFDSNKHHLFCLIVKLQAFSEWVFRMDFQRDQFLQLGDGDLNEILNLFCSNASDPSFPGYPYGSIDADLFSRVSQNELDYYRALISSQISNLNKQDKYIPHIRAGDAHNLLNTIAGF